VSKPTIRELLTDFDITDPKHEELAVRVEKVLALHSEVEPHVHERGGAHCVECISSWPCATVRLLDGEDV